MELDVRGVDQRCHRICPASSGTDALGWWGMTRKDLHRGLSTARPQHGSRTSAG
jgi:hypothetical protein